MSAAAIYAIVYRCDFCGEEFDEDRLYTPIPLKVMEDSLRNSAIAHTKAPLIMPHRNCEKGIGAGKLIGFRQQTTEDTLKIVQPKELEQINEN